ncbi:MAG TPA: phosphotransferase [archaeon]|nr:phosphotransferase [archaeon]HLD80376.1 phosphotransferase [archaeon]
MASNPVSNETKTKLKGGSYSATYLVERKGRKLIRKEASLEHDREYGYTRWHSQLKKLQRQGKLFPGLFPEVLDFGVDKKNKLAYFELEFIDNAVTGADFLIANPPRKEIDVFFEEFVKALDRLHKVTRPSSKNGLKLYVYEDMERPLEVASKEPNFKKFLEFKEVVFNGETFPSVAHNVSALYEIADKYHHDAWECYTHGDLTLENVLWVPSQKRIVFFDLYEENISDNVYQDYGKLLQSSKHYYEVYKHLDAKIDGNKVDLKVKPYPGIDYFNEKFHDFMQKSLSRDELMIVRLYELSNFLRTQPFHMVSQKDKMIYFYCVGCSLFGKLLKDAGMDGKR